MAHFDPVYGQLLNSREVANKTGLTMNQLRNMRQTPKETSIPFIKAGSTSWYREDDVNLWVAKNGTLTGEYIVPEGAQTAPLVGSPGDTDRREAMSKIANITTTNSWSKWYEWILEDSGQDYATAFYRIEELQIEFHKLANNGEDLRTLFPEIKDFSLMRKNDPHRFWPAFTYAIRRMMADIAGDELTDEEIMSPPIGEVPPTKLASR